MKANKLEYEVLDGGEIPHQIDGYTKKVDIRTIPPCREFMLVTSVLIKDNSELKIKLDDIVGLVGEDMQEYCKIAMNGMDVCPFTRIDCILYNEE